MLVIRGKKNSYKTDLEILGPSCLFGSRMYVHIWNEIALIRSTSRENSPSRRNPTPTPVLLGNLDASAWVWFFLLLVLKSNHTMEMEQAKILERGVCLSTLVPAHPMQGCSSCSCILNAYPPPAWRSSPRSLPYLSPVLTTYLWHPQPRGGPATE